MSLPRYLTIGLVILATTWQATAQTNPPVPKPARVFRIELSPGVTNALSSGMTNAFVQRAGASAWDPAYDGQLLAKGDRIQTRANVRLTLICPDGTTLRIGELADLEIQPEPDSSTGLALFVRRAKLYFFHRGGPTDLKLRTRTASAAVRGTEFEFDVEDNGDSHTSVLDGEVALQNELGEVVVRTGEQATAVEGRPPTKTAVIEADNIIQWCLYYPAILDLEDLRFEPEALDALKESLSRYREGNLLGALAAYPAARNGITASEAIYHSALLLSVGKVEESEARLATLGNSTSSQADVDRNRRLANALRKLIASVKVQNWQDATPAMAASEWLAESYHRQAQSDLPGALAAARQATVQSPRFGFAWARVAELEFGFARHSAVAEALSKALALSPENAQAWVLQGFIYAARNDTLGAINFFNRALALDNALGNAWLGRGLCRIRRGDLKGGLEDLQTAVVSEPQRAVLRSYLGKGFASAKQDTLAQHELELGRNLDPNDPTGWLYSALLNQQQNRINPAIADLQAAQKRNDNRSLFRSRLLLDEDRAVASANLASIYRDAGMTEVSLREASRAVTYDYAKQTSHLFLSDAYNDLRDPTRFNLRYETVWFNELLLANLLAPVGGGRLSQAVSEQEYSRLFEADGLHLASTTEARTDGSVHQLASQYGTFGKTSYALDLDYRHNDGVRPNNDLDSIEWYSILKQQVTPRDSALLLVKYEDYHSGDNFQYYYPAQARKNFRFDEYQQPILVGAWHHEWSPGMHTLLLGGRLVNEQKFSDVQAPQLMLIENGNGKVILTDASPMDVRLTDDLEIYTAGLSQVFQRERFSLVAGALWQGGDFHFSNTLFNSSFPAFFLPPVATSYSEPFKRITGYGYLTVEPIEKLWLIGGVSYDHLEMPVNFRSPPQSAGTEDRDLTGPKAAFVWSPLSEVTLRGIYSRSLGGVSLDESYRLEPTQLAGFPQAFRTVISESVVGSVAAPEYDVYGAALDLKLGHGTYGGVQFEHIESDVERSIGAFRLKNSLAPFVPSTTREVLDYNENSLSVNLNQLLGDRFVVGLAYRLTDADLKSTLPEVPASQPGAASDDSSSLNQLAGYALYSHPSGFFTRFDARWYRQSNDDPTQPGDSFVQLDLWAGYRFYQRKAELSVGLLNLTDQDYKLNPLTIYSELPRERVLAARFIFRF